MNAPTIDLAQTGANIVNLRKAAGLRERRKQIMEEIEVVLERHAQQIKTCKRTSCPPREKVSSGAAVSLKEPSFDLCDLCKLTEI